MNLYDQLWSENWQNLQQIGPLTHSRYRLMLQELPPSVPAGTRIIDIGCGNGTFLKILQERYPRAIFRGIEYSPQACQIAPLSVKDCIIVGGIIEVAPQLADDPYDMAICSEVLEHLPDPNQALKSIASLLKPNALALFTVPGGMRYWSKQDEVAGHVQRFEYEEFALLLEKNSFKIERHYGWGGPFAIIYDKLLDLIGPDQVMKSGTSPFSRIIAKILILLFRIDDFFRSKNGFQLITRTRYISK